MDWSREPKGVIAPTVIIPATVIRAVLGKHLETGVLFVQPTCGIGWVTWEMCGSLLVPINSQGKCVHGAGCFMGFQFEGQNPFIGDQALWVGAGHQGERVVPAETGAG